ncbi:MAG: hypothetical protein P3C10_08935, partial [Gemmatimonadota bacterium]|nr:hypothetical protein [Gemmatimonadota bacterium]
MITMTLQAGVTLWLLRGVMRRLSATAACLLMPAVATPAAAQGTSPPPPSAVATPCPEGIPAS